jgi:hypothetical protein
MWVAKETIVLGYADALEIIGDDGERARVSFPARSFALLSNHDGNALYIVPLAGGRAVEVPARGRKDGKKLFKKWSARGVDAAFSLKVPRGAEELKKIGYGVAILYTSDKWVSRARKYVHDFTGHPIVYADRTTAPRVFGVLAVRGARLVTARGIVG